MFHNALVFIIGIIYGIGMIVVFDKTKQYAFRIFTPSLWTAIIPAIVCGAFLLTVLVFSFFYYDWNWFQQIFRVGLLAGVVISLFFKKR